jgi:hypothetical protein
MGYTVQVYHTGNGGDFDNGRIATWMMEKGLHWEEYTAAYVHAQNSKGELRLGQSYTSYNSKLPNGLCVG